MNIFTDRKKLIEKIEELTAQNEKLKEECQHLNLLADSLERNNKELRELGGDPVEHAIKLEQELAAKYGAAADACQDALDNMQLRINRARSEGYKEAFAKMGMFALDKRLEGHKLYYDPDTLEAVEIISERELEDIEEGCISLEGIQ